MRQAVILCAAVVFADAARANASTQPPEPPPVKLLVTVATTRAVEMARNVLDTERIGDVLLVPRPHVLVHWDPARGSGHGSYHEYDTHVPLIFLGAGFARGTSSDPVTPYDLAPTLGAAVGVELRQATGRSLLSFRR